MPRKGQILPVPVGERFKRLVVLALDGQDRRGRALWRCLCDCGREAVVVGSRVMRGTTASCGCAQQRAAVETGERYGRLTVIERASGPGAHSTVWRCRCDCGSETQVAVAALRDGGTRSCGCLAREVSATTGRRNRKHGHARTSSRPQSPTYKTWRAMIQRCADPRSPSFAHYGARGVNVCERWRSSFEAFLADMGERPAGKTIDRVDRARGYEPGNCRWATQTEQQNNRSNNVVIEHAGRILTVTQWAREAGVEPSTFRRRLEAGWTIARAVATPVAARTRRARGVA